jgi:hypothetical protein
MDIYLVAIVIFGTIGVAGTVLLHSAACDAHVWAVDRAKAPRGWFYHYCRIVARLVNWI